MKVAVNGYGTIGKRIADALLKTGDFELVGVTKFRFDYSVYTALKKGIKIFVPREKIQEFRSRGIEPEGSIEELIEEAELVYDASPGKTGIKNKELYLKYNKPAIFQGGEPPEVAEISYSTLCNYKSAIGKKYVRVVSCNTTGILRILCSYCLKPRSVFVAIARRASDPREDLRGPVNSILLDSRVIPSHHARDVKTVIGEYPIVTASIAVPTTLMHIQIFHMVLDEPLEPREFIETVESTGRVVSIDPNDTDIDTTGKLLELARDIGRLRNDIYENIVFTSTVTPHGNTLSFIQAIHQESIVIPENIDLAYAMMNIYDDPFKVIEKTNQALGIGSLKEIITRQEK